VAPKALTKRQLISVPVTDQARAFYVDTLSFEVVRDDVDRPRHPVRDQPAGR